MLRRSFAVLLLMLTLSPFTAPFSTCDVTTLFGGDRQTAPQQAALTSSIEDGSHALPLCAASSGLRTRLKIVWRRAAGTPPGRFVFIATRSTHDGHPQAGGSAGQSLVSLRI